MHVHNFKSSMTVGNTEPIALAGSHGPLRHFMTIYISDVDTVTILTLYTERLQSFSSTGNENASECFLSKTLQRTNVFIWL